MQKSKLGISVGLLGSAVCLSCFFGGYTIAILLAAYILLREDNEWLRKTAVKAVATAFAFNVLSAVLSLLPGAVSVIDSILAIFGGSLYISFLSNLISALQTILGFIEKVLFIVLGLKALNQGTVNVPVIDPLVEKYM